MVYRLYSIRDIKFAFNQPFCDSNDELARRGFAYAINNGDIQKIYAQDFQLYCVGIFDPMSGKIETFDVPQFICDGLEVREND